jgi:hypothetical protein
MMDPVKYEGSDTKTQARVRGSIGEDVALGVDDLSAIPKGTIDPIYEAKARVLNRAVPPTTSLPVMLLIFSRFKTSAWDGTNGNSSS